MTNNKLSWREIITNSNLIVWMEKVLLSYSYNHAKVAGILRYLLKPDWNRTISRISECHFQSSQKSMVEGWCNLLKNKQKRPQKQTDWLVAKLQKTMQVANTCYTYWMPIQVKSSRRNQWYTLFSTTYSNSIMSMSIVEMTASQLARSQHGPSLHRMHKNNNECPVMKDGRGVGNIRDDVVNALLSVE